MYACTRIRTYAYISKMEKTPSSVIRAVYLWKLTKMRCIMRERYIEQQLIAAVKAKGGLALKFVSPGMAGVPDRIVLWPGGRVDFVELKAPGKHLAPRQVKVATVLRKLGHQVRVIDSVEKVKEFVDEIPTS